MGGILNDLHGCLYSSHALGTGDYGEGSGDSCFYLCRNHLPFSNGCMNQFSGAQHILFGCPTHCGTRNLAFLCVSPFGRDDILHGESLALKYACYGPDNFGVDCAAYHIGSDGRFLCRGIPYNCHFG